MNKQKYPESIEAGAEWLDKNYPNWESKINLAIFNMENGDRCVFGQVTGRYMSTRDIFNEPPNGWATGCFGQEASNEDWIKQINLRLNKKGEKEMIRFCVKVFKNEQLWQVVTKRLEELGYKKEYSGGIGCGSIMVIKKGENADKYWGGECQDEVSLNDLFSSNKYRYALEYIEARLGDNNAKVFKDKIQVGCDIFTKHGIISLLKEMEALSEQINLSGDLYFNCNNNETLKCIVHDRLVQLGYTPYLWDVHNSYPGVIVGDTLKGPQKSFRPGGAGYMPKEKWSRTEDLFTEKHYVSPDNKELFYNGRLFKVYKNMVEVNRLSIHKYEIEDILEVMEKL